ncbi:MAG: hypothetical protein H0W29_01010 [Gemmatimonadales bacterium]|nr:hypothetical protein [Gemmatimonadales bacterium]
MLVAGVISGLGTPLAAQVPAETIDSTDPRELDALVVTGTRVPAAVGGASVVVLHPDSLRVAPAPSLAQALRHLPFVLLRQNSRVRSRPTRSRSGPARGTTGPEA